MAEAYEVGIHLLMSGNVAEALAAMSSKLFGIHGQVKEIEKSLGNWKGLAMGAASVFAGIEIFKGLEDVVKHGAKLEHFEAQAKAAGLSSADVGKAISASWKNVGQNINASVSDSMKNILELKQATGSLDEAIKMLPAFTRTENALQSLKNDELKTHMTEKGQSLDFARSLDLLAVTQDEGKLNGFIAAMTREMIGMRGLVDGHSFMLAMQNAGGARYGWNLDFVSHVLGPLIQENSRNATGLYQLDRSFGSGVMTEPMSHGAEKYGLYSKDDEIRDERRHFKGMKAGSIAGYADMRHNAEEWALNTVLPLMKAHGVNVDDTNQMAMAINEISRGNKGLGVILDALLLPANRRLLAKERSTIDAVPDDAATILQKDDPGLAMAAFTTSWDNLLQALGKPLVHQAVVAIEGMAEAIDALAVRVAKHPGITKIGGDLALISAGLLALAGSIAVIKYALAIGRGVSAIAAAGAAGGTVATGAAVAGGAGTSFLGRILGTGAGLASLPALIDAVTDDNRTPQAKANDDAIIAKIKGWFGGKPAPMPAWPPPSNTRADLPYLNNPNLQGIGAEYRAAPAPPVNVTNITNLNVDGRLLASVVEKYIVSGNNMVKGSSQFDGRAMPTPVDHGYQVG